MSYYRFRHQLTPGIRILIIINTAIFVIGLLLPQLNRYLIVLGGLVPELFLKKLYLWQPLTYMFLHGGFMHIFFNMFALWMFGTELERHWGTSFFMKFYFVSGIGAGILSALIQPASAIPIIGASGAIYGILLGFAVDVSEPHRLSEFPCPHQGQILRDDLRSDRTHGLHGRGQHANRRGPPDAPFGHGLRLPLPPLAPAPPPARQAQNEIPHQFPLVFRKERERS
ncbi:MAG: rhomboid family intramembrane serine protease [Candidatus Marinimicrobia bacterium]|nr:rhomboid family intramembrane serine protease [Candidatus Neomarinimicrobiota bacterium]